MKVGDRVKVKAACSVGKIIIEPATPPLILEPGKEYVSRDGCWNRCLANDLHSDQPILLERKCTHYGYSLIKVFTNGKFWNSENDHDLDIIGPWNPKPVVDWSLYSKWTKAVAMDGDKQWYWFSSNPRKDRNKLWMWTNGCKYHGKIPPEYAPKNPDGTPWEGNWEDSLVIRPEE